VNGDESHNLVILHGDSNDTPPRVRWNGGQFSSEEQAGIARLPLLRQGLLDQTTSVRVSTVPVSATENLDFQPVITDVTFTPGESSTLVDAALMNDAEPEGDEAFEIRIEGEAVEPSASTARVSILSDEGLYGFATSSSEAAELAGAGRSDVRAACASRQRWPGCARQRQDQRLRVAPVDVQFAGQSHSHGSVAILMSRLKGRSRGRSRAVPTVPSSPSNMLTIHGQ
jgi:hypothetical protein